MAIKRPIIRYVDAHIHLWDLGHVRYPWLSSPFFDEGPNGSVEAIAQNYGLSDYFKDAGSTPVQKLVHIEAGAHPDDALKETAWLQAMADQTGQPAAIVGFAALNDPDVERLLEAHTQYKNVRGIRHIINYHPDPRLTYNAKDALDDPAFALGFAALARCGLSFDLQIYPNQMKKASALAARYDQVPVIINHTGMPVDKAKSEWREGLRALAALPQVCCKISGFGFIKRPWGVEDMRDLVRFVIDTFGPNRVAFASDFPTDKLFNTYDQALSAYDHITADFSDPEREALFATTAERFYRI